MRSVEYGFTVSLGVGLQDGFLAHTQCYERVRDVFLNISTQDDCRFLKTPKPYKSSKRSFAVSGSEMV